MELSGLDGNHGSGAGPVGAVAGPAAVGYAASTDPQRTSGCAGPGRPVSFDAGWLGAADLVAVAQRLQIPGKQQQWLQQRGDLPLAVGQPPVAAGQPVELVYGPGTTGLEA